MQKIKYYLIVVIAFVFLVSCRLDGIERFILGMTRGPEHKIEFYSGGVKVREWVSYGGVYSLYSPRFKFEEKSSRKTIEVVGDVIITELVEGK